MAMRPIKMTAHDEAMDELTDPIASTTANASTTDTTGNMSGGIVQNPAPNPTSPKANSNSQNKVAPNRDAGKKELLKQAKALGEAEGKGKASLIKFARLLVKGGAEQELSASAKSQDASQMYESFTQASRDAAANITDSEKASFASQLSKARAFIRLGAKYTDEAEQIFDDAKDVHAAIMKNPELSERAKYRSTYTGIYSIAVAQCKPERNAVRLTAAEMEALLLNAPVVEKPTNGVTLLLQALTLCQSAQNGRVETASKSARDPIDHDMLTNIIEALDKLTLELDAEQANARKQEIETMRQKKIALAAAKEQREADKAAKAREKEIQDGLESEEDEEEVTEEEVTEEEVTDEE